MKVAGVDLISVAGAAIAAPLIACIAVSWFASPRALEPRLTLTRPKSQPTASGRPRGIGGSLALWALACGAAVVVVHRATSDLGPRAGDYRTGIATLVLFVLAAAIIMRHRIASKLSYGFVHAALRHQPQPNVPSHNFSYGRSASWSIRPKTWQRMHIAVAIGAMLPFWWHCDIGRASIVDLLLKSAAILLLTSGFLGVSTTDLTRWRLLSPRLSPRFSAGAIRALFLIHRGLAMLTFILIAIHVLAVLYFSGL